MQAIIIGATGATGKDLLDILLNDSRYSIVKIFVRKKTGVKHPKLQEFIINFNQPESWQHLVTGDVLFSCLGTTLKAAGSKEAQYKIDYGYQLAFAEAAGKNNIPVLALVSSSGADANSPFFYMKMKGELEEAVKKLQFKKLLIFRPPMLIRKGTDRSGEKWGLKLISVLNAIGLAKSMKPLETEKLALTMAEKVVSETEGAHIFAGPELKKIN